MDSIDATARGALESFFRFFLSNPLIAIQNLCAPGQVSLQEVRCFSLEELSCLPSVSSVMVKRLAVQESAEAEGHSQKPARSRFMLGEGELIARIAETRRTNINHRFSAANVFVTMRGFVPHLTEPVLLAEWD